MNWEATFLGFIAVAVIVMAAVQVGLIVVAMRLARRVDRLADDIDQNVKPLIANLQAMSADAARAFAIATAQIERADRLFADLGAKVERTLEGVQQTLLNPLREGFAVLNGIRAGIAALRDLRAQSRRRPAGADDEDPLFIG